jgi:DNA-binding beta-propeller fold protein YncE
MIHLLASAGAALLSTTSLAIADTVPVVDLYSVTKSIPLGAPDRWDFMTYDASAHRIYVTHGTSIDVFDGRSGNVVGKLDLPGANGVAVVPELGKGYAGSRTDKSVVVFDLQTLQASKRLPADEDTDAVVYDPVSKRVFVMEGDPHKALVIDAQSDRVVGHIALAGEPESAAVDDTGHLFINIADRRAIQRFATRTLKLEGTWSVPECESPHGLAIDTASSRLFASCVNTKMVIVDATNGKVVQSVTIGEGTDAAAFDNQRKRVFSSNGIAGTVTVVSEEGANRFRLLGENRSQPSARTMAVDPETGRLFLTAADRVEVDPKETNPRKRYALRAGSVRLLFMDPKPAH